MTIGSALNNFFNSFGITAYPNTSVPDKATLPYLTYTTLFNGFDEGEVSLTVQIWYKTESEAIPSAKAMQIFDALGEGGKTLSYDDGVIWLKRGVPFCINQTYQGDNSIKLRQINITAEYF